MPKSKSLIHILHLKYLVMTTEKSISNALSESDAVILITGHKEFQNLDLKKFF